MFMWRREDNCLRDICEVQKGFGRIFAGLSSAKLEMLKLALMGGDELTAERTQLLKKLHAVAQAD